MLSSFLGASRSDAFAASRGPAWSALGVALGTIGRATAAPKSQASALESMRRSFVARQSVISALVAGDPRATRLILVHGTPGMASGWSDYLLSPPPGLEVVALDRPGFGRSSPHQAVPSLDAQAAAVEELLPRDGRRAVLLGHSLGGAVVARVAVQHGSRVSALVLLAASLDPALERIHAVQHFGAWAPLRWLLPHALRNANAELMGLKPQLERLATSLARIEAPVVIVHGTRDDLVPVGNVAFMQAHLTGARSVTTWLLEGRNHFLPWNSVDAVRESIRLAREAVC